MTYRVKFFSIGGWEMEKIVFAESQEEAVAKVNEAEEREVEVISCRSVVERIRRREIRRARK